MRLSGTENARRWNQYPPKGGFDGRSIYVRGAINKVMAHLLFGVATLTRGSVDTMDDLEVIPVRLHTP